MNIDLIKYEILSNKILPNKYINLLPKNVKLIRYSNGLENIIYLSDIGIIDKKDLNKAIGFIKFFLPDKMDEEKESGISFLNVNPSKKTKGIGTYLLLVYAWILNNDYGNIDVVLDDMSDNARGNSIYKKIGCIYDDDWGPEMTCKPIDIINTYNDFYHKYKNKGFFIEIKLQRSRSRSRSKQRSRSRSKQKSRSRSQSQSKQKSRSRSQSQSKQRSRSRSRSGEGIKIKKKTCKNK